MYYEYKSTKKGVVFVSGCSKEQPCAYCLMKLRLIMRIHWFVGQFINWSGFSARSSIFCLGEKRDFSNTNRNMRREAWASPTIFTPWQHFSTFIKTNRISHNHVNFVRIYSIFFAALRCFVFVEQGCCISGKVFTIPSPNHFDYKFDDSIPESPVGWTTSDWWWFPAVRSFTDSLTRSFTFCGFYMRLDGSRMGKSKEPIGRRRLSTQNDSRRGDNRCVLHP